MKQNEEAKTLLESLLEEINNSAPDLFKPRHQVEQGEERLGTITDTFLRKMYCVAQLRRRDEHMARTEAKFADFDDDEANTFLKVIVENEETADALMQLFWLACRRQFEYWRPNIGIRRGWVVVVPKDRPHPLAKLIMGLGEGE